MPRAAPEQLVRERRKRRKGLSLHDRVVTLKTRIRYFVAVTAILPGLEATQDDIDDFLIEWIDKQYVNGASITSVADSLSGLHHYLPWCRGKLKGAWKLYGVWRKLERPRQAPPFPVEMAMALVGRCVEMEDLRLALCLCLGFWGMLRTGEIFSVKFRRLLIGSENMIVRLGDTKTGLRRQLTRMSLSPTHPPDSSHRPCLTLVFHGMNCFGPTLKLLKHSLGRLLRSSLHIFI